jgi:alkanesulfonate monooxygenase SsuD/methylene tetrahydromethanopterin reductase-like flavin-dependent oxidoreductase (luciferase family)
MQWALTTLGDHLPNPHTGEIGSQADRHRQIVDLAIEAERLGARSVHLGEHHFCDYIVSSPLVVLATIAAQTTTLRLSTAVSLLAHHDPVTLAEQWATLDVLSGGRAELIAGRGVVPALYTQFGQDHEKSRVLVREAIELLQALWTRESVTWEGSIRPPLDEVTLMPRPLQVGGPPIWVSVSSTESIAEAVRLRSKIAIPLVSVGPDRGPELCREYREAWAAAGHDADDGEVALNVHCHVSERPDAKAYWAPFQLDYLRWVVTLVTGKALPLESVRPYWATLDVPEAQAVCGSVAEVTDRLGTFDEAAGGVDLWLFQGDQGGLPNDEVQSSMALFANEVLPALS